MQGNIKRTFSLLSLIHNIFTRLIKYARHTYMLDVDQPYKDYFSMTQEERENIYPFYDIEGLKKSLISAGKSQSFIDKNIKERKLLIEKKRIENEELKFSKDEINYFNDLMDITDSRTSDSYTEVQYHILNIHYLFERAYNNLNDEFISSYLEVVALGYIKKAYMNILSKTKMKIPSQYDNDYQILVNLINSKEEIDDGRLPIPYYNQNTGSYSERWHDGVNEGLGKEYT